jgi:hypothetical protein
MSNGLMPAGLRYFTVPELKMEGGVPIVIDGKIVGLKRSTLISAIHKPVGRLPQLSGVMRTSASDCWTIAILDQNFHG